MTLLLSCGPGRWRTGGTLGCAAVVALVTAGAFAQDRTPPFSSIYRRPSVSPFTMMGPMGGRGGAGAGVGINPIIYQQLVQPRFQQEQAQIQQMTQGRALGSLQRQVNDLGRGAARLEQTIRPTGHSTTFQNLSHFYPGQ
jgi:hypothetical protein